METLRAEGLGGQLELNDVTLRILRKGTWALLTQGLKGDKEIQVSQITAVQFKGAGFANGYIQFSFIGGHEAKSGIFEAAGDENSVVFTSKHQKSFEAIRDEVQRRIAQRASPQTIAAMAPASVADEISKLASLVEKGLITQDEFAVQKTKLLSGT